MSRINQALLRKLEKKLGVRTRRVYELIERKMGETHLDRHLAAIALASEHGIGIAKYATSEELAVLRGATPSRPITMPIVPSAPIAKRVVRATEPIILDFKFVSSKGLSDILRKDLAELNIARSQGLDKTAKTCMVLAGCIAEALLLDCLQQNEPAARAHASSMHPRASANIEEWKLAEMVAVAVALGLLSNDTTSGANQLRLWRNLIHPARALKEAANNRITPTAGRARSAISFLQLVAEELGT
jgi:hypothetical protein